MATKKQDSINLIDIFSEFKELKNIDRQTFINVLEDSFRNVITKMYGTDANYDVIINPDKGDLEIYRNRLVMEDDDVANPETQVGITEALELDDEAQIGEEVTDKVEFASFGRRMILNLRQTLASRILDLQKENLYLRYSEMLGQVVSSYGRTIRRPPPRWCGCWDRQRKAPQRTADRYSAGWCPPPATPGAGWRS